MPPSLRVHRRRGLFCVYAQNMDLWTVEAPDGEKVHRGADQDIAIGYAKQTATLKGYSVLYGPGPGDLTVRVEVHPLDGGGFDIREKPVGLA